MNATAIVIGALGLCAAWGPNAVQADAPDLQSVLLTGDTVSRMRIIVPYVKSLKPDEIPAALNQAIAGHGPGRTEAIDALSGRWVELDAPTALAFARQTSDREAKDSIETAYYGAWAERNPGDALEASNQVDAGEHSKAIWQIAHKMGRSDPQRAHALLKSVHAAKMADSDYFIFWHWASRDLPQATQTLLQEAKVAGYSYPCETAVWAMTDRLLDHNPHTAADWVAQLPAGKIHDEAFDRLESDWLVVDSDGDAAWLKSLPKSDQVQNKILNLPKKTLGPIPPRMVDDPVFATKASELDKILWESNYWREVEAMLPFIDGLTASEFPKAMDQLSVAPDSNREAVVDLLVERWSQVDPDGAVKAIPAACRIHDNEFHDQFLSGIYSAWANRDPVAAFADATRGDNDAGNYNVLQAIFAVLSHQDPVKAYAAFIKLHDANSHTLVIPIFTEWAAHDLPAATMALTKEAHWQGAIEGIVIGLMRRGPTAALAWAAHLPQRIHRDQAMQDIALRWPDDPATAAAWLEKAPAFKGKDNAFDDVAVDWAVRNPTEALTYATKLPDGKEKDCLLYWGLGQMTYDNAEAAQQFARQLHGDEMKKHALATVLANWSEYDPTGAANALSPIASEATANDVASVASSMSDGDPLSAVHWLDSLPASTDKGPAIAKIAANWYRTDSSAAMAWVNQLPAGHFYDSGASGICEALNSDLNPALKWARSITDSKMRHDEVHHAFDSAIWAHVRFMDISGAPEIRKVISTAPELTDAEKKEMIARLPKMIIFQDLQPPAKH